MKVLPFLPLIISYAIIFYNRGGNEMNGWKEILVAIIGAIVTLIGIYIQGRKDTTRIKDIDDKSNIIKPNTEIIIQNQQNQDTDIKTQFDKVGSQFDKVGSQFVKVGSELNDELKEIKNGDLRKISDFVTQQQALQQYSKQNEFDMLSVANHIKSMVHEMQEQSSKINQLISLNEEYKSKIIDLEKTSSASKEQFIQIEIVNSHLQSKVNELKDTVNKQEKDNQNLTKHINFLEKNNQILETELQELKQDELEL